MEIDLPAEYRGYESANQATYSGVHFHSSISEEARIKLLMSISLPNHHIIMM